MDKNGDVPQEDFYKREIISLITDCKNLKWLRLIYVYVKRLTK